MEFGPDNMRKRIKEPKNQRGTGNVFEPDYSRIWQDAGDEKRVGENNRYNPPKKVWAVLTQTG